jgi:Cys-tRNA(Pro)/Cys-tRNA(Cys) deacylase
VLKTLVVEAHDIRAVAVVPASARVDLKAVARVLGTRRADLAEVADAERATGYRVGAISPLGLRSALPTVIDRSVRDFDAVFVSAGQRGLEVELAPADLASLARATFESISGPSA